jgi:hypothetical protein
MTVTTQQNKLVYTGNGSSTTYPVNTLSGDVLTGIILYNASELMVYVDGVLKTLDTDYTITSSTPPSNLIGRLVNASVVFTTAPANTKSVVLLRQLPLTQTLNLLDGNNPPPEQLETALDKTVSQIQQVHDAVTRCFQIDPKTPSTAPAPYFFPEPNTFIGWSSTLPTQLVNITADDISLLVSNSTTANVNANRAAILEVTAAGGFGSAIVGNLYEAIVALYTAAINTNTTNLKLQESIPKPVQNPSNLFEVGITGAISAVLYKASTGTYKQFTGSNLTIATTSVGTAGGIDVARVSGQMYYLWLIGKDDGTLAGLFSASNTAPTMPTGYTWRRLLPWACATSPVNATYQNGADTVTDITGSGREGAFIEHLVSNWGRDGGNNPIITYISRFPNTFNNNGTNAPTLVSKNKPYNTSFYIENLACMNVSLSGQPMWLVPPEAEAVGLMIKGGTTSQMLIGIESFNGSGSYTQETLPIATVNVDVVQTPLITITSRRMRFANNVTSAHVGVREFRCNFTNFWI